MSTQKIQFRQPQSRIVSDSYALDSQYSQEFVPRPAQQLSGRVLVAQAEKLIQEYDNAVKAIPSYSQFVNANARKANDLAALKSRFVDNINSLVDEANGAVDALETRINNARFPMRNVGSPEDKVISATQFTAAVNIVNHLSQNVFPINQWKDAVANRQVDLASFLYDLSMQRKNVSSTEGARERDALKKLYQTFCKQSGLDNLLVAKVEAEIAVQVIPMLIESKAVDGNARQMIASGVTAVTLQSVYHMKLNEIGWSDNE